MAERGIKQTLLLGQFRYRILKLVEKQKLILYHINLLKWGDIEIREDFRFIQKYYNHALNLSTGQVREYMKTVDVDELKGFSTQLITRSFDFELYEESASEDTGSQQPDGSEPLTEEGVLSQAQLMNLGQTDQDIMTRFGFKSINDLEAYLHQNIPTYSPPSLAAAPADFTGTQYDENGFYIGTYSEDVDMEDYDGDTEIEDDADEDDDGDEDEAMGQEEEEENHDVAMKQPDSAPVTESNLGSSWADEVEKAIESGLLPSSSSTSTLGTSEDPSSEDSTTSSNEVLNLDPSLILNQGSSSSSSGRQEWHLSQALRKLLADIKADSKVRRSSGPIPLSPEEFNDIKEYWNGIVKGCKQREDRQSLTRHTECWEETQLLDNWDEKHCQFNWQTEGLFLCQLTELVYKEVFEQARSVFWLVRQPPPARRRRLKGEKLPGSPLRNQAFA